MYQALCSGPLVNSLPSTLGLIYPFYRSENCGWLPEARISKREGQVSDLGSNESTKPELMTELHQNALKSIVWLEMRQGRAGQPETNQLSASVPIITLHSDNKEGTLWSQGDLCSHPKGLISGSPASTVHPTLGFWPSFTLGSPSISLHTPTPTSPNSDSHGAPHPTPQGFRPGP